MGDLDIRWYLVHWHRHEGRTEVSEFDDRAEAFEIYIQAERDYDQWTRGSDPELEIVLIGAESFDHLKSAYPHYFRDGSRAERTDEILHGGY